MNVKHFSFFLLCFVLEAWSLWVPMVQNEALRQQGVWEPPGSTDSSFIWIDIPEVGAIILPPMAGSQAGEPVAVVPASQPGNTVEEKTKAAGESSLREAAIPRFNDVTADIEYGFISYKNTKAAYPATHSGFNITARARYERDLDAGTGLGVRLYNDFTKYTRLNDSIKSDIPGCDYLLIGPYYRKFIGKAMEFGAQANVSLFFRKSKKFKDSELKDVILTDIAINPSFYGMYTLQKKPVAAYAGAFAGYAYCSYGYSKHQIPYALLLGGGTTIGQYVAVQSDLAISHQFLVVGIQAPIYLSRLFSLTLGAKYPFVFEAPGLHNVRVTAGASTRF
jgi:hypothetical protein